MGRLVAKAKPTRFGRRLRTLRLVLPCEKGKPVTQRTLALAVGASKAVVYQIEIGLIREPSAKLAIQFAKALGTTVEYLVNGQGDPPSKAEVRKAYAAYIASKTQGDEAAEKTDKAARPEKSEKLKKAS